MADLNTQVAWMCETNTFFETTITGSSGTEYTTKFSMLFGRDAAIQNVQYGPTCSCVGFKYYGGCKHLAQMESQRCGWNGTLEPTLKPDTTTECGRPLCPECGANAMSLYVGV